MPCRSTGGLDGTGTRLASFSLAANASSGCTDSAFCNWTPISRTFVGAARSITFGAAAPDLAEAALNR